MLNMGSRRVRQRWTCPARLDRDSAAVTGRASFDESVLDGKQPVLAIAFAHYAAAACFPRLTLTPSSGRSVQNESEDSIVNPPTVRNVRCSALVTAT